MPAQQPFRPWWLAQAIAKTNPPKPAPLSHDVATDICIVGAGYTGLWTAILIKQASPETKVTVIEQDICGYGASGCNGGCVLTLATKYLSLIKFYGEAEATRLVKASQDAVTEIKDFTLQHNIDCDLRIDGALYMATNASQIGVMDPVLRALDQANINTWSQLTIDQAKAMAGTQDLLEAYHSPAAGSLQPALLVMGLARVAREMGVDIYEQTPMLKLDKSNMPKVHTPKGSVQAKKVVMAVNAWMPELFPEFSRSISVVSSDMGITEPCPDLLQQIGLDHGASICDSRIFVHYYHTTSDGRLLLGKGGNTFSYGSKMVASFFEPSTYQWQVRGAIDRFMPGLKDVKIESCWNGGSDRSTTGFPFFGALKDAPNVLYGFGYSGNGVTQALLGGKILRSLALDRDDEWSNAGFVGGPRGQFPPEPVRWIGANIIRNGIRRKEAAEDRGKKPLLIDNYLATFAKAAGKADK